MGGSNTGRHADGPALYGAEAVWPADWRSRWPRIRSEAERRFRAPARLRPARGTPRPLRSVLAEAGLAGSLRRLAQRHGVDEADVARLWAACDGGDPRATASRVAERLRLVRALEGAVVAAAKSERLRTRTATRSHLRVLALTAALALDAGSAEENLRRFLRGALPERIA